MAAGGGTGGDAGGGVVKAGHITCGGGGCTHPASAESPSARPRRDGKLCCMGGAALFAKPQDARSAVKKTMSAGNRSAKATLLSIARAVLAEAPQVSPPPGLTAGFTSSVAACTGCRRGRPDRVRPWENNDRRQQTAITAPCARERRNSRAGRARHRRRPRNSCRRPSSARRCSPGLRPRWQDARAQRRLPARRRGQ